MGDGCHYNSSPYQSLASGYIRVLELKAGLPDSPLEAGLHSRPLNVPEHDGSTHSEPFCDGFEAISYCWGDLDSPRVLRLRDGCSLCLTESLHSALQAFRYADRSRYLWADAVCINQDDTSERSAQVSMMADIYAKADRVLVWLGPCLPSGSETVAFTTLSAPIEPKGDRARRELLEILSDHLRTATHCDCCFSPIELSAQTIKLEDGLQAVAKLLERPWFGRLWVVQEVALAQSIRVHCGTHWAAWEIFTEVTRVPGQFEGDQGLETLSLDTMPRGELRKVWARCNYLNQLRARNRLRQNVKDPFRPTALCKDLLMLSHLGCRDAHDRIFGVSRVLGLEGFAGLRADYTIAVAELYRRVVELYVTAAANRPGGRAVLLLALVGTELPEAVPLEAPSWIPNLQYLSERSRSKYTLYQWTLSERQYYADASEFRCKISPDDYQQLLVRGKFVGTVKDVLDESDCPSKHLHRRSASKCPDEEGIALIRWFTICYRYLSSVAGDDPLATGNAPQSKQNPAISFGTDQETNRTSEMPHVSVDQIANWLAECGMDADRIGGLESLTQALRPYITGYPHDRARYLSSIETERGHCAAWIPPTARPADRIVHFAGTPFPFIMRPRDDGSFMLLGDASVLHLDECDLLNLERSRWTSLLAQTNQAEMNLKLWMESDRRARLKNLSNQDASNRFHREDQRLKDDRYHVISKLRAMYREADESFEWIRLS